MDKKIVGHRGASGLYPENTKLSITKAIELGVRWVEIDVQPTKDGELVVCHDFTVDRCSNGKGRVDSFLLEEIKQLDFGSWFKPEYSEERIMTITELLELAKQNNLSLNIEVKLDSTNAKQVVSKLQEALALSNIDTKQILLSSFSHHVLDELASQCSAFPIGLISEKITEHDWQKLKDIKAFSCHLDYSNVTETDITQLKEQGYQVWCYTVNTPDSFALIKHIDAIFTDFPQRFM